MATVPLRRSRGRQRVPMKFMAKDSNRYVTFSKRRAGLFKKASELCTLCGVDAAVIVFSPGKKVFSFGHPKVDGIVNRYMHNQNVEQNQILREYHESEGVKLLNQQLTLSKHKIELAMKKAGELQEFLKSRDGNLFKFTRPEQLTAKELKQIQQVLEWIQNMLFHHITTLEQAKPQPVANFGQDIMRGELLANQEAVFGGQGVTPDLYPNPHHMPGLGQDIMGGEGVMPNPNLGQNIMGICLGQNPNMIQPPLQMAPNPVEGQFNGHQNVLPSSMQMNPRPGNGYFTDLLFFGDDDEPALPPPYNPQGGNGFGPRGGNGFGPQGGNGFGTGRS